MKSNGFANLTHSLSYSVDNHLPFPAYFSVDKGIKENEDGHPSDVFQVRLYTQGKKKMIEYLDTIDTLEAESNVNVDLFVNKIINDFYKKIIKWQK